MELRDYQQKALKEIKDALSSGKKAPLLVLPTGAGKTVVFTELSKYLIKQNKKVLILVHRRELVKQACQKLDEMSTKYGVIAPSYPSTNNLLQVASVYTLSRRMHNLKFIPDYIIFDEAHHVAAKTWLDVVKKYNKARRIGVTATPTRLDGKSLKGYFDVLINGPDVIDLVSKGYLCKHKVYASPYKLDFSNLKLKRNDYLKKDIANLVKNKVITGNAVSHYKKYLLNKPTVVFCVDIPHAQTIFDRFLSEGIKAALLTGDTPQNERDKILDDLKNNIIHVVVSIDVISEGTDLPCVEGAILLRPTNSESLYRQQVGRILRPRENKTAIVLDHVNNTITHGFVDERREWKLEEEIPYGLKRKKPLVRTCQKCNHVFQFAKSCPECGFELSKKELIEVEGELEELKKEEIKSNESQPNFIKANYKKSIYFSSSFYKDCLKSLRSLTKKYNCSFNNSHNLSLCLHPNISISRHKLGNYKIGDNLQFYRGQNKPSAGILLGSINKRAKPDFKYIDILPPIPEAYKKVGFKDYWFPEVMKEGLEFKEIEGILLDDYLDHEKYEKNVPFMRLSSIRHFIDCLSKYKEQISFYFKEKGDLKSNYFSKFCFHDDRGAYTYLINKKNNKFIYFHIPMDESIFKVNFCPFNPVYDLILLTDKGIEVHQMNVKLLHEKKQRELIRNIYTKKQNSIDDFINIARNGYFKVGYNQDWVYKNFTAKKIINSLKKELLVKDQTPSLFKS